MVKTRHSDTRVAGCREGGFSLFEFAVAIIIISVLATVLLNRLDFYKERLEKAAMETMLRNIKTGLQVRLAELIIANRQAQASRLEVEDPVQWLEVMPLNYGGNYREPPDTATWYFDAKARQLVYVVENGDRLELDAGPMPRQVRFHTRLVRDGVVVNGTRVESVTGVALVPVYPYRWQ